MPENHDAQLALLREVPLFSNLSLPDLDALAQAFQLIEVPAEEGLFRAGDPTDGLYLVQSGTLRALDTHDQSIGRAYKRADMVGREALLGEPQFNTSVAAVTHCQVLYLSNRLVEELLTSKAEFNETLRILYNSTLLHQRMPMPWLEKGEEVNLMTRKHPAFLFLKAVMPVLVFAIAIGAANWLGSMNPAAAMIGLLIVFFICTLWLVWNVNNWANDFYIITNKRMVWVERVSGFYDSRQEAPLGTLISVGIKTTELGNILGYSDVIVRTYIGDIRFERVAHASAIGKLIECYWSHSKQVDLDLDASEIRKAIRQRFGKDVSEVSAKEMEGEWEGMTTGEPEPEPGFVKWLFSDFLKVRFDSGGTVVYRKHWFILLGKLLLPFTGMILASALIIAVVTRNLAQVNRTMALVTGIFLVIFFIAMVIYRYVDWRNDVFQLTANQVIDLDRKPFGRESRRSAPLENILSIESERRGIFPMLFNYGTVYINIGNTTLTFNNVHQPSDVQQDIFSQMNRQSEDKHLRQTEQDRDRISQWFKVYHDETMAQTAQGEDGITTPLNPPAG